MYLPITNSNRISNYPEERWEDAFLLEESVQVVLETGFCSSAPT